MRLGVKNLKLLIAVIVFLCSVVIVGIYSLFVNEASSLILLLCVWFFVGWLAFNRDLSYYYTRPTVFVFLLINGIRFFLLPIMILICVSIVELTSVTTLGCLLYFYEEVVSCLFLSFLLKKVYKRNNGDVSLQELQQNNSYLLYWLFVALAIIAVIRNPALLNAYNFIFADNSMYSSLRVSNVLNGFWGVAYRIGFLLFPCLISHIMYKMYARTKAKSTAILLVAVLLLLTLGFTEGTSRNSALIPAVTAMFLLLRCFPHRRKIIIVSLGVMIVIGFYAMTLTKFAFISSYSGKTIGTGLRDSIEMIEAYFSGPSNFTVAINAKNEYQDSFSFNTWICDIFGNWPVLSRMLNPYNRTTAFYNMVYYGRSTAFDQIIPATGQGIFHLGYVLSIVPVCLSLYISSLFDIKSYSTNDYAKSYIYSYAAVRLAIILIANLSITSAFIGSPFIEILLIVVISSRLKPIERRDLRRAKSIK